MTSPIHDKTMAAFNAWMQQIGQVKGLGKKPTPKAKPAAPRCLATKMGKTEVLRCDGDDGHKGKHNYVGAKK